MAVIGRRTAILISLLSVMPLLAGQSSDLRHRLSDIATALSSGNPGQAMEAFDKDSFAGYDKLNGFFEGLTSAYQVDSQVEVTDEESSDTDATLKVHWTLTLTDEGTSLDQHRDADITIKMAKKKGAWKIVSFAPLDIFDPQMKR